VFFGMSHRERKEGGVTGVLEEGERGGGVEQVFLAHKSSEK